MRSLFAVGLIVAVTAFVVPSSANTDNSEASQTQVIKPAPHYKTIRYAGSKYYPPLEWLDSDDLPQGFITDLRIAMAATDGSSASFDLMLWQNALSAVKNGDADAIALIPSNRRAKDFDFTQPFHYVAHGIFSHEDGVQYTQIDQLTNKIIAVASGAYAQTQLQTMAGDYELLNTADELDCLKQVALKNADACIEVSTTSDELIAMYDLPVQLSSGPFWPQPYAFGVKKGNTKLLSQLNQQLATVIVNGDYERVYKQWAHQIESKPHGLLDIIYHALWFFVPLALLATLTLCWSFTLRKKVAQKTQALRAELDHNRQLQQQIEFNAAHDNITGLLTRTAFFNEIDQQLQAQQDNAEVTLIITQISNLESMITVFGYDTAFTTVARLGERLSALPNSTCAHFGSGLFAIAVNDSEQVEQVIDNIVEPLFTDAAEIEPHLVFGYADTLCSIDSIKAAELVRRAITALTYAQRKKLKVSHYRDSIEPDANNLRLLNDFQKFGCRQFVLHFQPQLDLAKQSVSHVEALIRWQHPELGLIPPYQFIPLLEESGGIKQLTRWVIQQAVKRLKQDESANASKPLMISVNISSHDLVDEDFLPFVRKVIGDINPSHLVFEITESELIEESERAREVIQKLASMGIGSAVDDFGTGYSSLAYLNDLSVQEIKLDRLFVKNICSNKRSYKIVKSTIDLAHDLGLYTVAEGVEDKETLEQLKQLGCDRIQGYYIAKPMPEQELSLFLESFKSPGS